MSATPPARSRGDLVRTVVRGVGQTLITAGVVMLLFVVYTLYVTNVFAARDQAQLDDEITDLWAAPATSDLPGFGEAYARIYIPAVGLGMDEPSVVVQGVGVEDLKKGGPGHIPESQAPGEVGNTVLSGHRTTYGAPFADLGELAVGDEVIVETRTDFFTYTMTGSEIVRPSAIEVTYPVPGEFGAVPTQRLLTLTTCNPKYSARQRLVIRAELTATVPKAGGARPPALAAL